MYSPDLTEPCPARELPRWDRSEATSTLSAYEQRPPWQSQRDFAAQAQVPRTTLQHWKARKDGLDADPIVAGFLESPQGLAFVHRLVGAAHFTFNQVGSSGVRLMSLFLLLSRLDRVVAASKTAQHETAVAMEELIEQFGSSERERLAMTMLPKRICVCQDETFHRGQMCLVGIEPLSGFLLLEQYSAKRDEASWTEAMKSALAGLPVEVEKLVSDEARGLLSHARDGLGVHHGPELFHVQHDLGKATSAALQSRVKRAADGVLEARQQVQARLDEQAAYHGAAHGPDRPPAFEQHIAEARAAEQSAEQALQEVERLRSEVKDARHAISELYHPFDRATGQSRPAEALETGLQEQFGRIESTATAAGLSQASHKLIAKARRLVPSMVATMAFFFARMRLALDALQLEPALEALVHDKLIPGLYLQRVAEQAPVAQRKAELRQKARELLAQASTADSPLQALPEQQRRRIEETARRCAEMFVRSSSCVEGRNGQLALRHHSLHRLSNRKLAVLTTIHNYFLRRADGTTAAERFFGSKPQDLFEYILDRIDLPARPAMKRPRKVAKLL